MSTNVFQKEAGTFLKSMFPITERLDDAYKNKFGNFKVSQKPYDFFGASKDGTFWGAEVKKVNTLRLPFSNIPLHQRQALLNLTNHNCYAFLLINWRFPKAGSAIWIDYLSYLNIETIVGSLGRKSVKPTDFDDRWFITRIAGGWSISEQHRLKNII